MQLDGVTLEQALNQIMTMNQLSYKVLTDQSIFVFPDTPPKHAQYDEQVVRTFYLSHADATELPQILSTIIRLPGIAVQPAIAVNKTTNTITVRGTSSVMQILERIIEQNDKPRAEIVVRRRDSRSRSRRARKATASTCRNTRSAPSFSPEVSPSGDDRRRRPPAPGRDAGTPGRRPRHRHARRAPARLTVAAAVQPEHALARRQHGGLLSGRADGDRALPRDRHAHQAARQAAAARRRRRRS